MAVEVKVNVINQLKLLRQSTFKDIYCFLDEDVQNAQRAGATEAKITVKKYEGTVTIENNGKILSNPQALFSIAESGWDDNVKKSENPFGMGFFSNITVSNLINIHSGHKYITFNIEDMINTNNTEIKVEEVEEYYDGFKLILNNFDFDAAYEFKIEERAEILGKYIQELDIYYNEQLIEKKDLTEGDDSKYKFSINDSDVKGWIGLGGNYFWGDNINIFYKGRLVTNLEGFPYLKGDLHVNDKTLNLTSPDRKDIIRDDKLDEFKTLIKIYVEEYCDNLIIQGIKDAKFYSSCFNYYINKEKVKNNIKFITFKSKDKNDLGYLTGIAIAKRNNKNIESFEDYKLYLEKENSIQNEEFSKEVEIIPEIERKPLNSLPQSSSTTSFSYGYTSPTVTGKTIEEQTIEEKGNIITKGSEPVFYIDFSEIEDYLGKLNIAKHYDLKIIVSRNDVESSILKKMRETDNVLHISELKEEISVKGYLMNTELNSKEKRALMILDMISRALGSDHNLFAIGDLMVTKNVIIESLNINEELIEEDIVVLKDILNHKVYVDRSIINKNKLRDDLNENLDINDYKFILANFKNIVKEASLILQVSTENCEKKLLDILGNCA